MEHVNLILQIAAFATGLLYIFQAARLKRNCWIYGGISSLIMVYLYLDWKYYVDSGLNIYYVAMAFVGWFRWNTQKNEVAVSTLRLPQIALISISTVALACMLGFVFYTYSDADYPFLDSFAGALSITATWLTTKRKIENWPFWVIGNGIAIVLCILKGGYIITGLMFAYFILSIVGWVQWKKQLKHA